VFNARDPSQRKVTDGISCEGLLDFLCSDPVPGNSLLIRGNDDMDFENQLIHNLAEFIQTEASAPWIPSSNEMSLDSRMTVMGMLQLASCSVASNTSLSLNSLSEPPSGRDTTTDNLAFNEDCFESSGSVTVPKKQVQFDVPNIQSDDDLEADLEMHNELAELLHAKEAGVSYVMGRSYVRATKSSSWLKKVAINFVYKFLRSNCREPSMALHIPHMSLIEVGMAYYV
jgi:KUP system potassium uptake protein